MSLKSSKKNKETNRGITLIALVITIIVLLILAGVAIATLTGDNGLLTKAGNAKNTANEAEIGEKIRLAYQDYYLGQHTQTGYSFQDALDKVFGAGVATATGPDSNGVYTVSVNGKTYEFNPATKGIQPVTTTAWTKNADGSYSTGEGAEKITIHVGDYVNYDPTLGVTDATTIQYTSYGTSDPTKNNGRANGNRDQSFDAATYKSAGYKWRVLDVKNGKIRLISEEYVGPGTYTDSNRTTYSLRGQAGYINGIDELNAISSIFGHGKGAESAISITAKDINDITGYDPATAKYDEGLWGEYGNKVTYTYNSKNNYTATRTNGANAEENTYTFNDPFYYYDSNAKQLRLLTSESKEIASTYYYYYPAQVNSNFLVGGKDENGRINVNETFKTLFGVATVGEDGKYRTFTRGNGQNYWLASPYADAQGNNVNWGLRGVSSGGVSGGGYLCNSYGNEYGNDDGVRPVVSLKSDVQLEANGNNNWNIK